jgi:hypothetical protein
MHCVGHPPIRPCAVSYSVPVFGVLYQTLIRPGPGIFDAASLGHANEEEGAVH